MAAADLGQQQAQAHAALGDVAIFGLQLVVALAFIRRIEAAGARSGFDLAPDLVELGFDHARRQIEIVRVVELVEQRALGLRARLLRRARSRCAASARPSARAGCRSRAAPPTHRPARLPSARAPSFTLVSNSAALPFRSSDRIVVRERHLQRALVAGFGADELFFEAGNELLRADDDARALRRAALERFAIDAADEIDVHFVAIGGRAGLVFKAALRLREFAQRFVRLARPSPRAIGRVIFDGLQIDRLEVRHHFERQFELQILRAGDDLLMSLFRSSDGSDAARTFSRLSLGRASAPSR